MPNGGLTIPESILAHAAFEILVSSSLERYVRTADQIAGRSEFRAFLDAAGIGPIELLREANSLWRTLLSKQQREPEEVTLALLLANLASCAVPDVEPFLRRVALYDRVPLAWLSAQARELLARRPSNVVSVLPETIHIARPIASHTFATQVVDRTREPSVFDPTADADEVSDETMIAA